VLALLEKLPKKWAHRDDFTKAVVAGGFEQHIAAWLAMNLNRDTLALQLDLVALRAMLDDYYARDLWRAVEIPTLPGDVEYVIGSRSSSVPDADRRRLETAPPHVHVHVVEAGHWLNVDAPAAVVDLFVQRLPA
jgi:esterase